MECMKLSQLLSQIKKAFKKKTKLEQFLIIVTSLFFIIFIALILTLVYGRGHSSAEDGCTSSDCLKQVNYIVERMNSSMDPCKDFYQFACGHYGKLHVTTEDVKIHGVANDVEDEVYRLIKYHLETYKNIKGRGYAKAKEFYSKCTSKVEGFKDINNLVNMLLLNLEKHDLIYLFAKVTTLGSNPFFEVSIDKVDKKFRVILNKPKPDTKLTQLREDVYCEGERYQHYMSNTNYKELIRATKVLNGGGKTASGKNIEEEIIDFESRLATSFSEHDCDEPPINSCKVDTIKQNFAHKIINMFYESNTKPESVVVDDTCPSYSAQVFCKLLNESVARDYITWRHIMRYLPLISTPFRRAYMSLIKDMNKGNNIFDYPRYFSEQWKQCMHITNHIFGMALAYLFKKTEYNDGEEEIKNLADSALDMYRNMLYHQDWLDENVLADIYGRLDELQIAVGGPEWLSDRQKIRDLYAKLKVDNSVVSTIFQNEENATRKQATNKEKFEEEWFIKSPPISSEVKYHADNNVLVLPMGALRFPYFTPGYFKFSKYSSIGTLTTQAIYSAFGLEDTFDNQQSGNGSDYFLEEYRARRDCYKYQYFNDTKLNEDNMKDNDVKNILETIIRDNIALKVALALYLRDEDDEVKLPNLDYNAHQLFFIQYAQTYCEVSNHTDWKLGKYVQPSYRVNNVVSNSEVFAEVFSCPENSAMNRKNKCQMWN